MVQSRFDPSHSVQFDLARGRVGFDDTDTRLLVPATALLALCRNTGAEELREFGRQIGAEAGRRVASRLGGGLEAATTQELVEHLGGDLALVGLGSLGAERWGRALVLTVDGSPLGAPGEALLASVLEGAIERAFRRKAHVVSLSSSGGQARFLVANAACADKVRRWLAAGTSWGDVLTKLNTAPGEGP